MDKERIQQIVTKHRHEKAALLAILHDVQQQEKHLGMDSLKTIAEMMEIPFAHIHGLATFYSAFSTARKGRTEIRVCDGIACQLRGAEEILEALKPELKIDEGETTPDQEYSLERVHCLGLCAVGPNASFNETIYPRLDRKKVIEILGAGKEK